MSEGNQESRHVVLRWASFGGGVLSSAHLDAGAFTATEGSVNHPDVQIHFFPLCVLDHGKSLPTTPCYQIHIGTLRAHSKGYVRLSSPNFADSPVINPRYLSDGRDVEDLRRCLELGRHIMNSKPLSRLSAREMCPGVGVNNKKEQINFVLNNSESAYHPSCTCKMGSDGDKLAVLDPELRVRGVQNLRVVDSSSFPSITSGNLNAVVVMLAHKASDIILGRKPLVSADVEFVSRVKTG